MGFVGQSSRFEVTVIIKLVTMLNLMIKVRNAFLLATVRHPNPTDSTI
jgi:hypothetical protein